MRRGLPRVWVVGAGYTWTGGWEVADWAWWLLFCVDGGSGVFV